nr:hypothetical protein CFP56_21658 [Quercus suber]
MSADRIRASVRRRTTPADMWESALPHPACRLRQLKCRPWTSAPAPEFQCSSSPLLASSAWSWHLRRSGRRRHVC